MIIGVCGYGYTGTGAVYSLLREYSNVYCLSGDKDIEFIITYTPDGLEDLEYHLCLNPVKASGGDAALYRFQLMCKDLKRSHDRYTNGKFMDITNDYLDSLIQVRWQAVRLFEYDRQPGYYRKYRKLFTNVARQFLNKRGIRFNGFPLRERYLSFEPDSFLEKSRAYVHNIIGDHGEQCILLNQPFSSNNPGNSMRFFEDPFCIIVDRDPRDLYVMAKHIYGTNGSFIPTDNVSNFIKYYRTIRSGKNQYSNGKILKIHFEDLIYHYDETVSKIERFLDCKLGEHVQKFSRFKPEVSEKNTCVYQMYDEDVRDIQMIERELKDWLYDFESVKKIHSGSDLKEFIYL